MEATPSEQSAAPGAGQERAVQGDSAGLSIIKLVVFVVVATAIGVGAYFGVQEFLLTDDASEDDRRPVAVTRGTLLDDVTASGSVSFPELESLRFDIAGTVSELLVEEGEVVSEGQTLILLDDVTISALESAVANAEIDLQDAGEELAELLGGASELERATLESAVANADIDLQEAEDALADLLAGTSDLERAIAQSDLADARVAVKNTEEALAEFTSPTGADSPATIEAMQAVDDAREDLADAVAVAEDDAEASAVVVSDAQEVFDDSLTDYNNQVSGWFGSVVTEEDQDLSPTVLFEKWNTTVDAIFAESTALVDSPPDDPDTPWNESVVWIWTHLTPYPILTGCDTTSTAARCPSAEISDAWDVQVAAQETLNEAIDDAATAASLQQGLIDAGEEAVTAAADAIAGTTNETDIAALTAALDEARERERDAEATIAGFSDPDPLRVNVATAAITQAELELANAKEQLADIAPEALDPLQVSLATAAVNVAKAQLDQATTELAGTQLVAPFDGVISSISVAVGDPVNRNTATIDILDPSVITISGTVDEIDVLSLNIGDGVSIALDALPDRLLSGTIDEIGDGVNQQGVIEFPLTIALVPPEGIDLIEGLSATATIVLNQVDDALLIPLQAIGGSINQPTVDVVSASGFVTTPVSLGSSDDFWIIVESGLAEGQEVLMVVAESTDPFQQLFAGGGGAIRIPGGFTGGGGGRGAGGGGGGGGAGGGGGGGGGQ